MIVFVLAVTSLVDPQKRPPFYQPGGMAERFKFYRVKFYCEDEPGDFSRRRFRAPKWAVAKDQGWASTLVSIPEKGTQYELLPAIAF